MPKVLSEVARDALALPPAQRRTLARLLLETADEATAYSPEFDGAWEEEIVRRLRLVEQGIAPARSTTDVFAELDRRFGQ